MTAETALQRIVARVIGWTDASAVERVALAVERRVPLVLVGEGSLRNVARTLHRLAGGGDLTCIRQASGGGLERDVFTAVRQRGQAVRDFDLLAAALTSRVIMWSRRCSSPLCLAVKIPSMPERERSGELHRVIDEYGADAVAAFGAPGAFTHRDRTWILAHSAATLDEIEKGTQRRIALRVATTIYGAAALLGMSHVALSEWFAYRRRSVGSTRTQVSSKPRGRRTQRSRMAVQNFRLPRDFWGARGVKRYPGTRAPARLGHG